MGVVSTGVKGLLGAYFVLVAYLILSRIYLPACKCNKKQQDCEKICVAPFWALSDTRIDISVFIGQSSSSRDLVWTERNHSIADRLNKNISFPVTSKLSLANDTLFAWVDFALSGADTTIPVISLNFSIAEKRQLIRRKRTRNLLDIANVSSVGVSADDDEAHRHDSDNAMHWKFKHYPAVVRSVQIHSVIDAKNYMETLGTSMKMRVWKLSPATDGRMRKTRRMYDPVLWLDDLAITSRHYSPIERKSESNAATDPVGRFEFQFVPTSVLHYFFKKVLDQNMAMMKTMTNGQEDVMDEIKYYLSEDKLFTLALTQIIGWIHITLEYLAFQDDWKFFRGRKNFKGVSASSLIYSVFRSVIIFLYLLHQDTSWLVLGTLAKDILYETWKLYRIFQPRVIWLTISNIIRIPYNFQIRDISVDGDDEERKSSSYDKIASLHAGLCLYPILIGLPIYYLKTYTYSSWYSWFISSAVDCVYFFGFLAMLPQLYINYKFQSVAHLPIKAFAYKIFNTFVDDIFAFIVKMPLKHKIMTLRDDLIFFGFVYQWWIYPADKGRTNEFGFQYDSKDNGPATAINDTACADSDGAYSITEVKKINVEPQMQSATDLVSD